MLEIKPLNADNEADLHSYVGFRAAAQAVDEPGTPAPNLERIASSLRNPRVEHGEVIHRIACRDGEVVGAAAVALLPGVNARLASASLTVHPRHRRQGIGTALLEALLPELRARGRDSIEAWGVTQDSVGEQWAVARGFSVRAPRVLQRLNIAEVDPATWDVPAPPGYRALQWMGETPEHLLPSVASTRQSIHDAPRGDVVARPPEWTPELVRAKESAAREAGVEHRVVVAVEEATGEVVALTELPLYPADETVARQEDTVVTPAHRGHGLGRFVKAHMLRWLLADRPAFDRIDTQTSAENSHMIRVNEQLGFVIARRMVVVSRSC